MKVVLQRVLNANVTINKEINRKIDKGLLLLLGVTDTDTKEDAIKLAQKCAQLRIFDDEDGKLNLSATDLKLDVMVVSNFTLYADTKKGRRPSFIAAAKEPISRDLYEFFVQQIKKENLNTVVTGEFGADMQISLINDGPITVVLDTQEWKK